MECGKNFRAKRRDNGEWAYGSGFLIGDGYCIIDVDAELYIDEVNDFLGATHMFRVAGALCEYSTLCRHTGLYDAKGLCLYEGDIIRSFDSKGNEIVHHVKWEQARASFVAVLQGPTYIDCSICQEWLNEFDKRIIGNIYDGRYEDDKNTAEYCHALSNERKCSFR